MTFYSGPFTSLTLGLMACSNPAPATDFRLMNGVSLPLHENGKLQPSCEAFGSKMLPDPSRVCVEFPASVVTDEFEPVNWYSQILVERGFEWASGAANQYWFNWPTQSKCYLRLNLTALPKERIESDDWSEMKDYVAVFEFEADERCEEK